jgi:hypothetical protein
MQQPPVRPSVDLSAHRELPERETDPDLEDRIRWSRPVVTRFGLERTLHFSGTVSDAAVGTG